MRCDSLFCSNCLGRQYRRILTNVKVLSQACVREILYRGQDSKYIEYYQGFKIIYIYTGWPCKMIMSNYSLYVIILYGSPCIFLLPQIMSSRKVVKSGNHNKSVPKWTIEEKRAPVTIYIVMLMIWNVLLKTTVLKNDSNAVAITFKRATLKEKTSSGKIFRNLARISSLFPDEGFAFKVYNMRM